MRNLLGGLLCAIGAHNYRLVLSRYICFDWRRCTFSCKRCKKKFQVDLKHDWIYPFPTTLSIEQSEYD